MKAETYTFILCELRDIIKNTKWESHVFAVGGCVRDQIMHNEIKDIDLCVDLCNGGIDFAKWLEENGYTKSSVVTYENFGTAMFHLKKFPDIELEVVQTRSECYHDAKTRNPETSFGTIEQDWERRDFTINAMYINVSTMELIDFNNRGQEDIKNKIIRTCGDPDVIFMQDPLRILRMIRFASRYGFNIEQYTLESAKDYIYRLDIISKERITDEFTKMMTYSMPSLIQSLCLLHDLGGFDYIIPDLYEIGSYDLVKIIDDFKQTTSECPKPNITVVLTKLLYHSYKIYKSYSCNSMDKFEYIKYVLQKVLIYPNDITNEVIFLTKMNDKLHKLCTDICVSIYEHAYEVRRIMNLCGDEDSFWKATVCGSIRVYNEFHKEDYNGAPTLFEEFSERDSKFYTYKLPIDGEDVMKVFNIEPSPKVKKILDRVFTFALINTDKTSRKDCLDYLTYLKQTEDNGWFEC